MLGFAVYSIDKFGVWNNVKAESIKVFLSQNIYITNLYIIKC